MRTVRVTLQNYLSSKYQKKGGGDSNWTEASPGLIP